MRIIRTSSATSAGMMLASSPDIAAGESVLAPSGENGSTLPDEWHPTGAEKLPACASPFRAFLPDGFTRRGRP